MKILSCSGRTVLIAGLFCWMLFPALVFAEKAATGEAGTPNPSASNALLPPKVNRRTLWRDDSTTKVTLSGGVGEHFEYPSLFAFRAVAEMDLVDHISAGLHTGIVYGDQSMDRKRSPYFGPRLCFHLPLDSKRVRQTPWDFYLGLAGDFYLGAGNRPKTEFSFEPDILSGARLRLYHNWSLWGELTARNINLGLSLRL